jgi:hypothetical protein
LERALESQKPVTVAATTKLHLHLSDTRQRVESAAALRPEHRPAFDLTLRVFVGWRLTEVTDGDGEALDYETIKRAESANGGDEADPDAARTPCACTSMSRISPARQARCSSKPSAPAATGSATGNNEP